MCGIVGIYNFSGDPVSPQILKSMRDTLHHRGPDGKGFMIDNNIGLGHRRLSIIDLSEKGKQPMSDASNRYWITYNGEVYNFLEIRKKLEKHGFRFISNTDTEVVLCAYIKWGEDCLRYFNGMFSFCIYDQEKHQLFLARDRMGIKPLFFYKDESYFIFASEIKAIIKHPKVKKKLDHEALHHYLSYYYVTTPQTLFQGIKQVKPAHYMVIDSNKLEEIRYWDFSFQESNNKLTDNDWLEGFHYEINKSVKLRLMSDVPFGAFLSGGIDSSSIVSYMSSINPGKVKTFSMGFKEKSFDETDDAQLVANKFNTNHYKEIVEPNLTHEFINKLIYHSEDLMADPSSIPVYLLSKMTRKHVTMALSGDGCDELLAGYETYQAYYFRKYYLSLPKYVKNTIQSIVNSLPVSLSKVSLDYKLKSFIQGAELPVIDAHLSWREMFNEDFKKYLYNENSISDNENFPSTADFVKSLYNLHESEISLNKLLELDTKHYLSNDMLVKVDRMSMANSLEVRVPFLDHNIVEFVSKMPLRLKLRYGINKKYALKKIMKGILPARVLRKKKKGFFVPMNIWFCGPLKEFAYDTLSLNTINSLGIFSYKTIENILNDHINKKKDYGYHIWCLLVFVLWYKNFEIEYSD